MRFVKFTAMLIVAGLFVGVTASQNVAAQTVPFFIAGSGNIPEGLPLIPGESRPHNSVGFATSVGVHKGEGAFEIIGFTSATTATFQSTRPYKFTSFSNRRNTLACNYGTVDTTPAATEAGEVTLYPVDPANGIFYAVFIAEFTPALEECTGKFRRLTDGNFLMVAISEPFQIVGAEGLPLQDDPDGQIQYSWYGVGTLTYGRR